VFLGFFNTGTTNSRPWIIEFFLGTQAVGVYAAAMGIYQSVASLVPLASVLEPVLPQFVHEPSRLARLLQAAIKYQFIITVALVGGVGVVVYPLFSAYLPSYVMAIPLFLWCSVSLLPDATARIFEVAFSALRLQRDLFFSNLTRFVLVLVFLPIFISIFGIIGIALELLLTQSMYMWSRYRVLGRHIPNFAITWQDMWRVSDLDRLLLRQVVRPFRRIINRTSL
jgi:O-antigen/teichoic acid export membrane protein